MFFRLPSSRLESQYDGTPAIGRAIYPICAVGVAPPCAFAGSIAIRFGFARVLQHAIGRPCALYSIAPRLLGCDVARAQGTATRDTRGNWQEPSGKLLSSGPGSFPQTVLTGDTVRPLK